MEKSQPYYGSYDTQYPQTYPKEADTPRAFGLRSLDAAYTPPKYNWFEESQRNKPQSNSVGSALFVCISGGMSLAWSVGFAPAYKNISQSTRIHMQVCWFVAVILGAIVAAILIEKLKKRTFNFIATVLVIINGILFLSDSYNITSIIVARYFDGFAVGLTVIPMIMAGSEQSVKILRGLVMSMESVGLTTGIMLQTIYSNLWTDDMSFNATQMHGALATLYGVLGLVFACFLTIESPTFYLRRDQEPAAIECLRKLQRPHIVTTETYSIFYEDKKLLEEDVIRGLNTNFRNGLIPFVKLCFFRVTLAMSFSLPLSIALINAAESMGDDSDPQLPLIFYGTMRSLGAVVAIFTLDTLGRKYPTAVGTVIIGGLMIAVGSMYANNCNPSPSEVDTIIALLMTYQFIAGFCAATSTTYLGEAFSISVKPYFILASLVVENVVQIIICSTYDVKGDDISVFSLILGVLHVLVGLMIGLAMPETKKTTLREALCMFKAVFNFKD